MLIGIDVKKTNEMPIITISEEIDIFLFLLIKGITCFILPIYKNKYQIIALLHNSTYLAGIKLIYRP